MLGNLAGNDRFDSGNEEIHRAGIDQAFDSTNETFREFRPWEDREISMETNHLPSGRALRRFCPELGDDG